MIYSEKMNICFCADSNYVAFIPAVIESIYLSNKDEYVYHIISDTHCTPDFLKKVSAISSTIDVKWHITNTGEYNTLKEINHFTKAMYYRLSIPDLIQADKVLYLDCDILVRKNINILFKNDINNVYAAAVTNPFFNRPSLNLPPHHGYFNSGVLLINTKRWREHSIKQKVIDLVKTNHQILEMPDQDALNLVFNGLWARLPPTFNAQMSMFLKADQLIANCPEFGNIEFLSDPTIVHFSATNKQWHRSCSLKYASEYQKLKTSVLIPKRGRLLDSLSRLVSGFNLRHIKNNNFFSPIQTKK